MQVQFHETPRQRPERVEGVRRRLNQTHCLTYSFPYVWENWRRRWRMLFCSMLRHLTLSHWCCIQSHEPACLAVAGLLAWRMLGEREREPGRESHRERSPSRCWFIRCQIHYKLSSWSALQGYVKQMMLMILCGYISSPWGHPIRDCVFTQVS